MNVYSVGFGMRLGVPMSGWTIVFPRRPRGRPTTATNERYTQDLSEFCKGIKEIRSRLEFQPSSRGWCYILEEHGLGKGDFDAAERVINDARKIGLLPLNICAEDKTRLATGWEDVTDEDPEEFADSWIQTLEKAYESYTPISFWEYQSHYVEMLVEKIDLKTLFSPICGRYRVPIANARGWSDINGRAAMMRRFKHWEDRGKQCVLLYSGDHDPVGLNISDTMMKNFEDLQAAVDWDPGRLVIDRFGLNADFIEANNLTWIDGLETGSGEDLSSPRHPHHNHPYVQNYLKRFGARKVEANTLVVRPEQGRDLCHDAILKYIAESGIAPIASTLRQRRNRHGKPSPKEWRHERPLSHRSDARRSTARLARASRRTL
jgi:hypothetical protein